MFTSLVCVTQVDLVRVLVNEKLPDKDNDTGADLSQRTAAATETFRIDH